MNSRQRYLRRLPATLLFASMGFAASVGYHRKLFVITLVGCFVAIFAVDRSRRSALQKR